MDWNAAGAGYVISAYTISGVSFLALIVWVMLRDKSARSALAKRIKN